MRLRNDTMQVLFAFAFHFQPDDVQLQAGKMHPKYEMLGYPPTTYSSHPPSRGAPGVDWVFHRVLGESS